MFGNRRVDIRAFGKTLDFSGEGCIIKGQPCGKYDFVAFFDVRIHDFVLFVGFNGNDVTRFHKVTRNVDDVSVYRDVTVVYDLARHSAAAAEAKTINNVIEAAFDKNEHVFAVTPRILSALL